MVEKPSKLQPALLGGLVLGLGSVIPGLSYGNVCCCGWGIVGGALAAYLLVRRSPVLPVTKSDGAAVGALAGVVGSAVYLVIGVPLTLLQWNSAVAQMQERADAVSDAASREAVRQLVTMMQNHPVFVTLIIWLLFAIVGICVSSLGGLVGAAIFEKRKGSPYPPTAPPPHPGYGAGYATGDPPSVEPPPQGPSSYGGSEPL
ncbi:MAG: hypothetical protein WAV20_26840 [Blastocatellia bacterium]